MIPKAFFDPGTGLQGPRIWVDLSGSGNIPRDRRLRGGGALREVRIGSPDGLITRLMLEFALDAQLDSSVLRLVGITPDRWRMELFGLGNQAGFDIGEGDPDGLEKIQPQSPKLPSRPPARFDASIDELVRDGVVSPVERARIRSLSGMNPGVSAHQRACISGAISQQECSSGLIVGLGDSTKTSSGPTIKPLSPNEQSLLQRIRSNSYTPQWRTYGQCKYDWAGWKLNSNGTRTTEVECGGSAMGLTVGVSCDRLLVATYTTASGWSKWREPAGQGNKSRQGEDEMMAALCANV